MSVGFKSSQIMPTIRSPASCDMRTCAESAAGIDEAPGSVSPIASTTEVIVEAVPIVLQVPTERVMRASRSTQSSWVILPARSSSQYLRVWVPAPTFWPCQREFDIGPAGT